MDKDREIIEALKQQDPLDIRLEGSYCDTHRAALITSNVKLMLFELFLVQKVIEKCGGHDKWRQYHDLHIDIQNSKLNRCYSCLVSESELIEIMKKATKLEATSMTFKGDCTVGNISIFTNITEELD